MSTGTGREWAAALVCIVALSCGGGGDSDGSGDDAGGDGSRADGAPLGADAGLDASVGFDGGPDAAPVFVCDPVAQTGCSTGEKCDIDENGTFGCVPDGTIGDFERCEPDRPNACVAGFTCRDTNYGDFRCARLCDADEQCHTGETCTSQRKTSDDHPYLMCAPTSECQPFLQDCIDPADFCAFTPVGAFCLKPGAAPLPDESPCQVPADCEAISACLDRGPVDRCTRLCDPVDGEPGCADGVECRAVTDIGPQQVGGCGLP
jgi:hypothetical protein